MEAKEGIEAFARRPRKLSEIPASFQREEPCADCDQPQPPETQNQPADDGESPELQRMRDSFARQFELESAKIKQAYEQKIADFKQLNKSIRDKKAVQNKHLVEQEMLALFDL